MSQIKAKDPRLNQHIDTAISILRYGWCQGNYHQKAIKEVADGIQTIEHQYCLKGAVIAAFRCEHLCDPIHDEIWHRLRLKCPVQSGPKDVLVIFNDHPDRKVEEVIALLESCKDVTDSKPSS